VPTYRLTQQSLFHQCICFLAVAAVWPFLTEFNLGYAFPPKQEQDVALPPLLPQELPDGSTPGTMLRHWLLKNADQHFDLWGDRHKLLTNESQIRDYQQELKQSFLKNIGQLPAHDTLLQAEVTGRVQRPGYSVEKILFQSQPNFYVTSALFLPDTHRFPPPWPAVVVLCGHSAEGKLQDGYQRGAALAAINGLAALIVDPISQGERLQILDAPGERLSPTTEHTLIGTGAILVGWNTARWMIHDGMRAIDYLTSRSDIQIDRIGVMGNSGGGTQTSYLMALDDRVSAAAPSCYLTTLRRLLHSIGPQDAEQNIFGQIAWGMDHVDYVLMRAPRPTLIACASDDYFDVEGTWITYRIAKRVFHRLAKGRHVELVEVDASHGWHPFQRVASVQFMRQHLAGSVQPIEEPELLPLSEAEMQVTPYGQVLRIDGAQSTFDHVRDESERLRNARLATKLTDEALVDQVQSITGMRSLDQIPHYQATWLDDHRATAYQQLVGNERVIVKPLILSSEEGILLPGILVYPGEQPHSKENEPSSATCLFLEEGFASSLHPNGEIIRRCLEQQTVLAVDLRGIGETRPTGKYWYNQRFGVNGGNAILAYLQAKSLVSLRAEDMLACVRWVRNETNSSKLEIIASGELTCSAYLAAFIQPEHIDRVTVRNALDSWTKLAQTPLSSNQIPNIIHGILKVTDLPEIGQRLGDRLTIEP
jgi:cephalosporin-C deacetylase-like acetyl esterase